jgi:hypothetical protein
MIIDFVEKIKKLGGIDHIEEAEIKENIEYIKNIMGILPDNEIINFTKEYGFSMFNNNVYVKPVEKNYFLNDGKIKPGK